MLIFIVVVKVTFTVLAILSGSRLLIRLGVDLLCVIYGVGGVVGV